MRWVAARLLRLQKFYLRASTDCFDFQTNVKGNMVMAHAFLPTKRSQAAIVGVSAAIVSLPTDSRPSTGASAYTVSKMAQIKLLEYIASENPDVFVAAVHPGIVQTQMVEKSGMTPPKEHLDDGESFSSL